MRIVRRSSRATGQHKPLVRPRSGKRIAPPVRSSLDELRFQQQQGIELLFDHAVNGDDDVRTKRVGPLKVVVGIEKDRVLSQIRRLRAEERDRDHEGRVLGEHAHVTVVGMIVVRPVGNDQIGVPGADQPSHGAAIFQGRHQLAVMDVQHLRSRAQDLRGRAHLGQAPGGQGFACHAGVPGVAIGDRGQFHVMSQGRPEHGRSTGTDLRIVGMSPEDDDSQLAVGWPLGFDGQRRRVAHANRRTQQQPPQNAQRNPGPDRHRRSPRLVCKGILSSIDAKRFPGRPGRFSPLNVAGRNRMSRNIHLMDRPEKAHNGARVGTVAIIQQIGVARRIGDACPGGATENSPAIYRWAAKASHGRASRRDVRIAAAGHGFKRPSGTHMFSRRPSTQR